MRFSQEMRVRCSDPEALVELLAEWDRGQAEAEVMGYIGTRLLADREHPGEYMILAEFAQVDEDVSSAEEAEINNQRTETDQWARSLRQSRRAWLAPHRPELNAMGARREVIRAKLAESMRVNLLMQRVT